ncbi:hypothetical protein OG585_13880 [Streptomyces sp. NBC_01340]|uniref:hypothetical protein n=1 Tax=unclassified Streptomyces TaxID=2593676 RepID=UPI002251F707|nr:MULTISPECIES: hypothetical protein [unclassified Streptomyces]MCX4453780.1 hypothetical protein [Streptomyces sp. NBC_01719]MCX4493140.1 hypothetical protein [Streptomyces sp. NBC_01728]WSI38287.1 hypothetical protein OG585_13880 [Streptomyces sp. NBC_01340]
MTSDNGSENSPRREAMTGRGGVDPLVRQDAQDAPPPGPGTPADPAAYDPGEAPRRPADRAAPGAAEARGGTRSRETANPSRSTAGGAAAMPADDRDIRAGQEESLRGGQAESTRAGQGDRTRAGRQESAAGQRDTGPQGNGDGALLSHDECDKYSLRLQHAVGGFVDGPRASVEEADHVLEELTTEFTDAMTRRRRNLRTTWQAAGEGDTADTEKLRLALRDYREVTERLLHL